MFVNKNVFLSWMCHTPPVFAVNGAASFLASFFWHVFFCFLNVSKLLKYHASFTFCFSCAMYENFISFCTVRTLTTLYLVFFLSTVCLMFLLSDLQVLTFLSHIYWTASLKTKLTSPVIVISLHWNVFTYASKNSITLLQEVLCFGCINLSMKVNQSSVK